jgi:NAD(P)-dependent dehydrogenase (short-subunit alcohol dehydrogenase family)
MTLLALGWAEEFRQEHGRQGIASNCLWPETYIATAAVTSLAEGTELAASSRSPEIMADAAVEILTRPARETTGQCFIDADLLVESGVTNLSVYGGGDKPIPDLFLDL